MVVGCQGAIDGRGCTSYHSLSMIVDWSVLCMHASGMPMRRKATEEEQYQNRNRSYPRIRVYDALNLLALAMIAADDLYDTL